MSEKNSTPRKIGNADWFFQGVLTKIGDTVDRITGRRYVASSSLATSELIERIKKLLDTEAITVAGKGTVVPHNIRLKIQWDKFATDSEALIGQLETELLTATIDHINDSLYYTYSPVTLEVKTDYFVEGVKLQVGFDNVREDDREVEMNVTVPAINLSNVDVPTLAPAVSEGKLEFSFELDGVPTVKRLTSAKGGRFTIGRGSENLLVIKDASVSGFHAAIILNASGEVSIADTGSTNGTFINDERIAYGKTNAITESDKLRFGLINVAFSILQLPKVIVASEVAAEPNLEATVIDEFEFRSKQTSSPSIEVEPEAFEATLDVSETPENRVEDGTDAPNAKPPREL